MVSCGQKRRQSFTPGHRFGDGRIGLKQRVLKAGDCCRRPELKNKKHEACLEPKEASCGLHTLEVTGSSCRSNRGGQASAMASLSFRRALMCRSAVLLRRRAVLCWSVAGDVPRWCLSIARAVMRRRRGGVTWRWRVTWSRVLCHHLIVACRRSLGRRASRALLRWPRSRMTNGSMIARLLF